MKPTTTLLAREARDLLADVALGKRVMARSSTAKWSEIYHGLIPVEIDGWSLILFNDFGTLDYCDYYKSPDGRVGTFELWQGDGADPIEMLETSMLEQLERLLSTM